MKKTKILLAVLLASTLLFSSCAGKSIAAGTTSGTTGGTSAGAQPSSEGKNKAHFGGVLKAILSSDPVSMDPIMEGTVNEQIPAAHIFETALAADQSGEVFPCICTYEVKEDGRIIELKMRDKIPFHNGDICDIYDVEASAVRWMANISFAKKYVADKLKSMKVVGNSLVFTFIAPSPLALTAISAWDGGLYIMPKEICEKHPDSKLTPNEYIGTGPYKFKEHLADRYVLLEKFKDYIPCDPLATGLAAPKMGYADQIYFYAVSDKTARINGVRTGEYDMCIGVPANMIPTLSADPNLVVETKDMAIMPTMHFNCQKGPATDINLRNAIISCLNMDDLMMLAQGAKSLYYLNPSLMQKSSRWHTDESLGKYNNVDLDKAREYLAASSYNGEPLVFITTKDNNYFYKTAMLVADMVKPIGINMDVQVYDNATLKQFRTNPDKFDIFSGGLTGKLDPTLIAPLQDGWAGFYVSKRKDALCEILASEMDFNKRRAAWVDLTKVLYEDLPVITFGERSNAVVYRSSVHDLFDTMQQYYWNTWVD